MVLQIKEQRIDINNIVRYYPHVNEPNKTYCLYIYQQGLKDYFTITMRSKEELDSITEYLDKLRGVQKLVFTPELEITKSSLTLDGKKV